MESSELFLPCPGPQPVPAEADSLHWRVKVRKVLVALQSQPLRGTAVRDLPPCLPDLITEYSQNALDLERTHKDH